MKLNQYNSCGMKKYWKNIESGKSELEIKGSEKQ
jgi:hypothetical protein